MRLAVGIVTLAVASSCRVPDEQFHLRDAVGATDGRTTVDTGNVSDTGSAVDAAEDAIMASGDAAADAKVSPDAAPTCNLNGQWGTPVPVLGLGALQSVARFSPDEMTAYFSLDPAGGASGGQDTLYVATRSPGGMFGAVTELSGVNDANGQSTPAISANGDSLYYVWGELPLHTAGADRDIYRATLSGSVSQFGSPTPLSINAANFEDDFASIAPDGSIWWSSKRATDSNLTVYYALPQSGEFGPAMRQDNLTTAAGSTTYPLLSPNLLHIYVTQNGVLSTATRTATNQPFGAASAVTELASFCTGTTCRPAWISPDGCRLYIGTGVTSGTVTMYVTSKP